MKFKLFPVFCICVAVIGFFYTTAMLDYFFPYSLDGLDNKNIIHWRLVGCILYYVVLWAIFILSIFELKDNPKRIFNLDRVNVYLQPFNKLEVLDIPKGEGTYVIPSGATEFFIDLEATDTGKIQNDAIVYQCIPVFHKNLNTVARHSRDDLVKVTLLPNGEIEVKYIGTDDSVYRANPVWSITKEKKNA